MRSRLVIPPSVADMIEYATVREVHSSSQVDVGAYLQCLQLVLCIGDHGFLKHVVGGEQQNLCYNEEEPIIFPVVVQYRVPGDWHCLKILSEVIN